MSKYKVLAVLTIDGRRIRSTKSAINELQVMLDDYADNNSESGAEIEISIKTIQKDNQ